MSLELKARWPTPLPTSSTPSSTGAEQKAVAEKPTQNAAAYDVYLHAVAIDNAAPSTRQSGPLAFMPRRFGLILNSRWHGPASLSREASSISTALIWRRTAAAAVKEAADRAMSLQPELGEAWLAQGVYRYRVLRDFHGALQSYKEALRRLPNSAFVLEQMAHLERRLGQVDVAQKHYQAAAQLDPRNIGILLTLPTHSRVSVVTTKRGRSLIAPWRSHPGMRPHSRRRH